jgi:hypothetical protein
MWPTFIAAFWTGDWHTNLLAVGIVGYLFIGVVSCVFILWRRTKEKYEPNGRLVWDRTDNARNISYWFTLIMSGEPIGMILCVLFWPLLLVWNLWRPER